MKELIEAFQIFLKYSSDPYPTHCEHDVMYVNVNPEIVSEEDKKRLEDLGFNSGNGEVPEVFYSYKFGSC